VHAAAQLPGARRIAVASRIAQLFRFQPAARRRVLRLPLPLAQGHFILGQLTEERGPNPLPSIFGAECSRPHWASLHRIIGWRATTLPITVYRDNFVVTS